MQIHCFLSPLALAQVRRALPPPHRVSGSPDWNVLLDRLRDRACDAAIVDPCAGGERSWSERVALLGDLGATVRCTPVVGYVSVTAAAIKAAHALARLGAAEVVVRGLDDAPDSLAATIQRAIGDHAAARLVDGSAELFAGLPASVADAINVLFRRPERTRSVADLANTARTTRRSLDRHLARAGLAPARTLLACARANAAYHILAAGGVRPSGAASLVGYRSTRALAREFRALTGHVPSAVPGRLSVDRFVAAVNQRLLRPAKAEHQGPSGGRY